MIERLCKQCSVSFPQYATTQTICGRCAYNRYAKPQKPIKRMGKVAKQWIATRKEWISEHPGPWSCYLCDKTLSVDTLTLDHVLPRSRAPHLRYKYSNLKPACWKCNDDKGSKVIVV